MRIEISFCSGFIALLGLALFNPLNSQIITAIFLAGFFLSAGNYSLNNLMDKEEDLINRKKQNYFVDNYKGIILCIVFFLVGIFLASLLTFSVLFAGIIFIACAIIYSCFKCKKITLFKNFFTGFGGTILFFIGALNAPFSIEMLAYYFLIALFFSTGSIISDLRDFKGDQALNIKTLPVRVGFKKTKQIIYGLTAAFTIGLFILNAWKILLLAFSAILMMKFLYRNSPETAHTVSGLSLIAVSIIAMLA